jgi:hypothetical protein
MLEKTFETNPGTAGFSSLPEDRSRWPAEAKRAFHDTLAELNAWDRTYEHRGTFNVWFAEQAVREAWTVPEPKADLKVA